MPGLKVKDPAERLELACLYANDGETEIKKMASAAKEIVPGISARCAMVHPNDLKILVPLLEKTTVRPEVVIDFPDGKNDWETKEMIAKRAVKEGALGGDLVVNLSHVTKRKEGLLVSDCRIVQRQIPELKLIAQIPYLWQYDREAIPWLLDLLPESGVYCIKDWTTRQNFSPDKEIDVRTETRLMYTEYIAKYITKHNLPLLIKIAGKVDATNALSFKNAGADLFGISYPKAKAVREALL